MLACGEVKVEVFGMSCCEVRGLEHLPLRKNELAAALRY